MRVTVKLSPATMKRPRFLNSSLSDLAFRFGAFQHGVGMADRVGEGFVREIVKAGIGRVACAMGELLGLG